MKINLFSVPISLTSKSQALALIGDWLLARRARMMNDKFRILNEKRRRHSSFSIHHSEFPKIILTPNPEMIVAAQSDPEFLKALQSADLAIPDGVGVIWAVRIKSHLPHSTFNIQNSEFSRVSGLDLMESLISEFSRTLPKGLSPRESPLKVMLLGGRPGAAAKAARKCYELWVMGCGSSHEGEGESDTPSTQPIPDSQLTTHNSQLEIRALSGPQDIESISKSDNDRLITSINHVQPDLLFVAFGHPKQEKWLMANRFRLNAGVAMAVGGALDQIADPSLRPPAYINSIGLGWLYRLLRQPWRIKRQLALVKFVGMVIKDRILEGRR